MLCAVISRQVTSSYRPMAVSVFRVFATVSVWRSTASGENPSTIFPTSSFTRWTGPVVNCWNRCGTAWLDVRVIYMPLLLTDNSVSDTTTQITEHFVCLSVYLSVSNIKYKQLASRTTHRLFVKILLEIYLRMRNNPLNFWKSNGCRTFCRIRVHETHLQNSTALLFAGL